MTFASLRSSSREPIWLNFRSLKLTMLAPWRPANRRQRLCQ